VYSLSNITKAYMSKFTQKPSVNKPCKPYLKFLLFEYAVKLAEDWTNGVTSPRRMVGTNQEPSLFARATSMAQTSTVRSMPSCSTSIFSGPWWSAIRLENSASSLNLLPLRR